MLEVGEPEQQSRHDPFENVPPRRRLNLDWITCDAPPDDLTPFELFTRNVDWENTYFGPPSGWDEQLRSAVLICLADPEPAALLWGDKQHMIYNEAYAPLIGTIHPRLQGQEPRPAFGVLWDDYEANYRTCAATGGFVMSPGLLTMMTRFGYEEECYFSFKWAPYIGKDGNLTGVYASCSDTTQPIIQARRQRWLRELGSAVGPVGDFSALWNVLSRHATNAPTDLPNFMVYSKLGHGSSPTRISKLWLEACVGVKGRQYAAPREIDLQAATVYANAMCTASARRSIVVLRELDGTLPQEMIAELEPRSFGVRSTEIAICPVFSATDAVCYVVVGLSPKKRFGPPYESFLRGITDDITTAKLSSILLAHEKLRGRMLAKQAEDERNRRIEELESSERKYRQFAEHAPLGMVRLDMKGDLVFCNEAWKKIFSYREADGEERPWMTVMHPDDAEISLQFFNNVCNSETREPLSFEHRLLRKENGVDVAFWVLVTGFRENDEHVICWVTDIQAQKAAAITLNEKMQEAIIQRTRQENFIDMISHEIRNPLSAVLHCSEDIIKCASSISAGGNSQDAHSAAQECLESAQTISYCVEHQKRIVDDVLTLSKLDADLLEIALVPVEPRKAIRSALRIFDRELRESGITMNIVEHKSLDAMDVSFLMLDPNRFLQVLINLVTNSIKFTRSAKQRHITIELTASAKRPTPPQVRFFPSIRRESPFTTRTTTPPPSPENEIIYLGISVCDTGKGLTQSESHSLFNRFAQASPKTHIEYGGSGLGLFISRQIVELMHGQIGIKHEQEAGCTFAFFVQTQRVTVDQDELSQAADKLKISLTHHPVTPLSNSTVAQKLDTPPVLTPLERSASGLSTEMSGKITIEVDAGDDQSETAQSTAKRTLEVPKTTAPAQPQVSATKVLVVEDNLINQKVVCKQLRNRGYEVHAANHGGEALAALKTAAAPGQEYFAIILCDIEMPVMDGIACTQELRRLEKEHVLPGHIPMIAVTANARSTHVERAMQAGMDDVTTKPYRMDELVAQMEQVMSKMRKSNQDGG